MSSSSDAQSTTTLDPLPDYLKDTTAFSAWIKRSIELRSTDTEKEQTLRNYVNVLKSECKDRSEDFLHCMAVKYMLIHVWLPFYNATQASRDKVDKKWMELPPKRNLGLVSIVINFWEDHAIIVGNIKTFLGVVVTVDSDSNYSDQKIQIFIDLAGEVEKAFTGEYVDHTFDGKKLTSRLFEELKSIATRWNPSIYVAPYTSIIQSSGYGKTRLVCELPTEHEVFVIYCCYRPNDESGFPLRSSLIVNVLLPKENFRFSKNVNESLPAILKFTAFHCACIQLLIREIRDWQQPSKTFESVLPKNENPPSFQELCQMWLHVQINRDSTKNDSAFWKAVLQIMNNIFKSMLDIVAKVSDISSIEDFYERLNALFTDRSLVEQNQHKIVKNMSKIISDTMASYEGLFEGSPPLIVSVSDEARALVGRKVSETRNEFHYHRSSCGLFPSRGSFVAVYMDTSARLANFQPPTNAVIPPSYRSGPGVDLFEPFYHVVTTDAHSGNVNEAEYLDAITSENLDVIRLNLFYLGRPLWGSLMKVDVRQKSFVKVENVLTLAKQKLSRCKIADYSNLDEKSLFSLFQLRARLFMQPSSEYATEMVADYMATLLDIYKDRKVLRIDYPSDPVMCEAAVEIMNSKGFPTNKMLKVVSRFVKDGLVSGGVTGECVAKFLLLTAFDSASKSLSDLKNVYRGLTRPMTVHQFLKTLTGKETIMSMLVGQVSEAKLKMLMEGTVFFNHFIAVDYTPQMTEMKDFFLRGAAVDCMPYQKGIDLIIPILLKDKTFTAILVQVKNYQKSNDPLYATFCHKMTPFRCGMDTNPSIPYPYLSLYMQLGYEEPGLDTTRKLNFSSDGKDHVEMGEKPKKKGKLEDPTQKETQSAKATTSQTTKKRSAGILQSL